MTDLLPDDQWDEGAFPQYPDGAVRVSRTALSDPDTYTRLALLIKEKGPQEVEIKFTPSGRPVWLPEGAVFTSTLVQVNRQTFRLSQEGRNHPVDYWWEEVEWMKVGSALPSVI
jgi:hypothetical protein